MIDSSAKQFYLNLIAGRLPVGSASPMKVVSNQAYAMLGTNRLHVFIAMRGGYAYYFAVESQYVASMPGFQLPFTEVLPGEPMHKGDGVYCIKAEDYTSALIIEGAGLRLVSNAPDVMEDFLLGLDLPIHELTHRQGKPLTSVPQEILGVSEKVGGWINKISLGTLGVCALVYLGLNGYQMAVDTLNQPTLNMQAVENDLNATLDKLSVQQPLAMQLSRVQRVSATAIRSGGWIEKYSMNGQRKEDFEIMLPSWVSQDYLDQLGRDVVTDLRDVEGLLIVRKNNKGK